MPTTTSKDLRVTEFVFPPAASLFGGDEGDLVILSSFFVDSISLLVVAKRMAI
jgi:hypothetical protein